MTMPPFVSYCNKGLVIRMSNTYDLRNGFIKGEVAAVISEDNEMQFLEWCESEGILWRGPSMRSPTEWIPSEHGYELSDEDGKSEGVCVLMRSNGGRRKMLTVDFADLVPRFYVAVVSAGEILGQTEASDEIIISDILDILQ